MRIVIIEDKDVESVNDVDTLEELQNFCHDLITKTYWHRWYVFEEIDNIWQAIVDFSEALDEYKSKYGRDDEVFCKQATKLNDILSKAYDRLVESYNKDLYDE